jgi:biotin-dependent carboxylase-like uncharacterized protein
MTGTLTITRAGPLTTIQDAGRFGFLACGVSASGPVDTLAFNLAGAILGKTGRAGIEFTRAGFSFEADAPSLRVSFGGGQFSLTRNGEAQRWPAVLELARGDRIDIAPGAEGNYGYVRFDHELDLPDSLGSLSTSLIAGLGGLGGRSLRVGDSIALGAEGGVAVVTPAFERVATNEPIRVVWGLHAELFGRSRRSAFLEAPFIVSDRLDRMGVRLKDPSGAFADAEILSLVSDAVVPGDIQILGDGTPIVLLRDHQPTGGYPRIATVISSDLGRFAQLRPGAECRFASVTAASARRSVSTL